MISILEYKCLQWKLIQIQKTYCASNAVQTINNMTYLGTWACHLDIKNTLSWTVMVLDISEIRYLEEGFSGIHNVAMALTNYDHIDKDWRFSKM